MSFNVQGAKEFKYYIFRNHKTPVMKDSRSLISPDKKSTIHIVFLQKVVGDYIVIDFVPSSADTPIEIQQLTTVSCFEHD